MTKFFEENKNFNAKTVKTASIAAEGLCKWVINNFFINYYFLF